MMVKSIDNEQRIAWLWVLASAVRAAFGVIWAIDAYLKWQPAFADHFVGYFQNAAQGQPAWLQPWFAFWITLVTPNAAGFIWATRIIETLIAIALLLGFARRWTYLVGIVYSLLIWSTVEGFGGPYTAGATDIGPGIIYVLVFVSLGVFAAALGRTPYGVDYYLERRFPNWGRVSELAPPRILEQMPPRIPWSHQLVAVVAMVAVFVLFLSTLESAMSAAPATPGNAAAAVSPLSLASSTPIAQARDANLPPLIGPGDSVSVNLNSTDTNVDIANGVQYQAWTFGGTVPGPVLHVRQGQTVNVTFTNQGAMEHSIDFHAAEVDPRTAYRSVKSGQSVQFSFVARTPGAFVYHCGTAPVLFHIANGMYGAIIVDPVQPLPQADVSYVIVQGEWYTKQVQGNLMGGDYNKMQNAVPNEVVFNGVASQYKDRPLPAKVGQRVRIYFVDAGPSLPSAFHVIGGMFAAVYPDGDPTHALTGVSTYGVAPGQGMVFDIIFHAPGQYPFVDHSMRDMSTGAVGVIDVTP